MLLRCSFLKFLYGCSLKDFPILPREAPEAAAAVPGLSSVIKCMSMPYFDRAVLEFILWKPDNEVDMEDNEDEEEEEEEEEEEDVEYFSDYDDQEYF